MFCWNMLFKRAAYLALGAVLLASLLVSPSVAQTQPEYRGYWVDAFHAGFKSSAEVDQLLQNVRASNMNTVVVQMRKRGDTYFPSNCDPWATDANQSFDALDYLIQQAHNGTPRVEVHVWLCTFPIWSSQYTAPTQTNHAYNLHPNWLMQDINGAKWDGDNYKVSKKSQISKN
jgi:uncharacterized lipoprotein YddW (UPF0748 family)